MPPDPARIAETRAWLEKAALDGKTLKAFLAWHDKPFRKTHSLEELGAACEAIDGALRGVIDPAVPLPTVEEARQGLSTAMQATRGIIANLPFEAVPPSLRDQLR
jgi:hypothetical protein